MYNNSYSIIIKRKKKKQRNMCIIAHACILQARKAQCTYEQLYVHLKSLKQKKNTNKSNTRTSDCMCVPRLKRIGEFEKNHQKNIGNRYMDGMGGMVCCEVLDRCG